MFMQTSFRRRFLTVAAFTLTCLSMAPATALDLDIGIKIGTDSHKEQNSKHKNGPPGHAPAHGYRAKHQYHYYPSSEVYYDTARGMYFYLSDNDWKISASLPGSLKLRLGEHVTIEMESDKPYTEHQSHKSKYSPGQAKHQEKRQKK